MTDEPAGAPTTPETKRGPSLADVARRAGVSTQTVSRVANGLSNVREETRGRVVSAMRELGYRPNVAARALKRGRYHSIGVITFTLSTYGNQRTVEAIALETAQRGYSVTLIQATDRTMRSISGAYNRLAELAVDGVILILEAKLLDQSDMEFPPDLPVVVIDSDEDATFTLVDHDQAMGARQATEHLITLGHRKIWHLSGPERSFSSTRRSEAWRRALTDHGLEAPPSLPGDWTTRSGYELGRLLAARDDVTAVFAANDHMALGLLRALHEEGRRVPHDVSVVGFDNAPETIGYWPPLTSVEQDFSEVARLCVDALLAQMGAPPARGTRHLVPTRLIVRESTAPPSR